jgi:molybdopterin converting factor small subunit
MPVIWIPALLRDLTGGQEQVRVPGATLRQALDQLEARHPGLKARLLQEDQLRPDFSVVVDGTVSHLKLRQPLTEDSEVHLLPTISGG